MTPSEEAHHHRHDTSNKRWHQVASAIRAMIPAAVAAASMVIRAVGMVIWVM